MDYVVKFTYPQDVLPMEDNPALSAAFNSVWNFNKQYWGDRHIRATNEESSANTRIYKYLNTNEEEIKTFTNTLYQNAEVSDYVNNLRFYWNTNDVLVEDDPLNLFID